jgi:hypothetical protein
MPRPDGFEYVERGDDVVIIHRGMRVHAQRGRDDPWLGSLAR